MTEELSIITPHNLFKGITINCRGTNIYLTMRFYHKNQIILRKSESIYHENHLNNLLNDYIKELFETKFFKEETIGNLVEVKNNYILQWRKIYGNIKKCNSERYTCITSNS